MKIPQFLYVPRVNTLGTNDNPKLIIETRKGVYWQVLEFENNKQVADWYAEKENELKEHIYTFTFHKKYPVALICIGFKEKITNERLVKLGEMACDWYVQFWLENKKLSAPQFDVDDVTMLDKARKYFSNWIWGDNTLSHPEYNYLVNLEYGVSIKFHYGDAFYSSFEDFETNIADIQFLAGSSNRPPKNEVRKILLDAWNYLGIEERLSGGLGIEDLEDLDDEDLF